MKDSEFLELLNLYLDHEITAADSARLEAEVQGSPARRRTYLEYCRMQKACTLLAKDFVDQPAEKKVIAFEPRRTGWGSGAFAVGGLAAAAACVALVLVNRAPEAANVAVSPENAHVAAAPAAVPTPTAVVEAPVKVEPIVAEKLPVSQIARAVTMPVRRAETKPMFVAASLGQVAANPDAAAMLAVVEQSAQAQLEWIKTVQLTPMQVLPQEALRLDPRSPLQPAGRTYTNGQPTQDLVERAAFRFQR
jgi:hypothetical protein